jgi:hypothetical protein
MTTATTMDGSILATLTFLPKTRFTPTQKISTEPTRERFESAAGVITGLISLESTVTEP